MTFMQYSQEVLKRTNATTYNPLAVTSLMGTAGVDGMAGIMMILGLRAYIDGKTPEEAIQFIRETLNAVVAVAARDLTDPEIRRNVDAEVRAERALQAGLVVKGSDKVH